MKKIILLLFFPLQFCFGQSMQSCDSLAQALCVYVNNSSAKEDSTRLVQAYDAILMPYLNRLPPEDIHATGERVYQRFMRNCESIAKIFLRLEPPADGVSILYEKPASDISKKEVREFSKLEKIDYVDRHGERVRISFDKDEAKKTFADGSYSTLKRKWTGENEFELVFISSTSEQRNNFSLPGEGFTYRLLGKGEGFYELSMNIPGQNIYQLFKVYVQE